MSAEAVERLGEKLFVLSDRLRRIGALDSDNIRAAYEAVVRAYQDIPEQEPAPVAMPDRPSWPPDATRSFGDAVETPRRPVWRGKVCGWYRNSEGRLGYNVEADAIPLAIHNYPETGLTPSGGSSDVG